MRKTAVKWEPDYWREQDLPSHGCFGFLNGHLILGNTHHQMIMALVLHAGWTFEQLMAADQAWGWFELNSAAGHSDFDMAQKPKHLQNSYYVDVRFSSDAGFQQEDAMNAVLGAFSQMYHLPAKKSPYGVKGKQSEEDYGAGLSGKQNLDYYLQNPDMYFAPGNFRRYFPGGMPGQPPGAEWDPDWEKKFLETGHEPQEKVEIPGVNTPKQDKSKVIHNFPIGSKVRVIDNRWDAGVENGEIGEVVAYGPEEDNPTGVGVAFDEEHKNHPWWFHPNDLRLIPETPPASDKLKEIAQQHFDKYGDHPLNGLYWTGSNYQVHANGNYTWFDPEGNVVVPTSNMGTQAIQGWLARGDLANGGLDKVDHRISEPETLDGAYNMIDSQTGEPNGMMVTFHNGVTKFHYPNGTTSQPITSIGPPIFQSWIDSGAVKKIGSLWRVAYTPGGKTKGWGDIMEKANYIRSQNGVQIVNNEPQHVVGTVVSATDPQNRGPYQTEIWRDDPQSQAITMWDCDCDWDQYAWGRTRQWKKYEGRPCCHVLALFWEALTKPPAGGGGGQVTPPTPTPGGGVTVNQGLIQPVGQPPMPNVPLIGPEGEPAPIGPEPEPAQPPWSEIVQPGKEEGTIQFPGTFSHRKEASEPRIIGDDEDGYYDKAIPFYVGNGKVYPGKQGQYHAMIPDPWEGAWEEEDDNDDWSAGRYWPEDHKMIFYNNPTEENVNGALEHFSGKKASAPTEPPNYRKADDLKKACGTCKMFYEGKCWGYGNKPVERDAVCDSWTLDKTTAGDLDKEAAGDWWSEMYGQGKYPPSGTFAYIGGQLVLGGVHHKAIMSELLNAGWTWEQLMAAEQAWGWFSLAPWDKPYSEKEFVSVKFVSDSGYQNEPAMEAAKQKFAELYHLPVQVQPFVGGVETEEGYGTGLGANKALPGNKDWVGPVPPPPVTGSWKEAAGPEWLEGLQNMHQFQNGDIVRVWEDVQGMAQEAYGQPEYPVTITKNMSGEVLSSNPETTVAIFPLKTGPLEHHLVKVECPTSNLYLDNTNAQPFVKRH